MSLPYHVRAGTGSPTLIFVHGFACDHTDWRAQIDALAPAHLCLACDLPGHGATPAVGDVTIDACAASIAELVMSLDGTPVVLIGHSLGCRVVLQAACDLRERVVGVALVDGSWIGHGDPARVARDARAALRAEGYPAFSRRMFDAMFLADADPALRERTVARARALAESVAFTLFPDMIAWDAARMADTLAALTARVQVLQSSFLNSEQLRVPIGPHDTTPWLDLVRAIRPDAGIGIIEGVGHFPQIEAPAAVNTSIASFVAIERISRHSGPTR